MRQGCITPTTVFLRLHHRHCYQPHMPPMLQQHTTGPTAFLSWASNLSANRLKQGGSHAHVAAQHDKAQSVPAILTEPTSAPTARERAVDHSHVLLACIAPLRTSTLLLGLTVSTDSQRGFHDDGVSRRGTTISSSSQICAQHNEVVDMCTLLCLSSATVELKFWS